ncbi:helix-turn-helix domain-containing protein [Pistricoccus aurantiacus]|uniref:helix-turn-helix domain-containing protein n=1 Tax=Pistricoccus aurantiacus TaxID=1883414 RepID=UPI0036459CF8
MTDIVHIANALPGLGKTESFINSLSGDEKVVYASRTKSLNKEVYDRLKKTSLHIVRLDGDSVTGWVRGAVELALLEEMEHTEGVALIITQATLTTIDPEFLEGWSVVVDEVPVVGIAEDYERGEARWKDTFNHLIDVCPESGKATIKDGQKREVVYRYEESLSENVSSPETSIFKALLSDSADVRVFIKKKGTREVYRTEITDSEDYASVIRNAQDFHVMGNSVEKTLFFEYILSQGFRVIVSPFQPANKNLVYDPTYILMFEGDRYSKTMALKKEDGTQAISLEEDTLLGKSLTKCLEYANQFDTYPTLVQGHDWIKGFPFDRYGALHIPPICNGINEWRDHSVSCHLFTGNPVTTKQPQYNLMFEMLGVDKDKGYSVKRHEECIERGVQGMGRTNLRMWEEQVKPTYHIVPTEKIARQLAEEWGVDNPKMDRTCITKLELPKQTEERNTLKARAIQLRKEGMTIRQIAEELGVGKSSISRWLKQAA